MIKFIQFLSFIILQFDASYYYYSPDSSFSKFYSPYFFFFNYYSPYSSFSKNYYSPNISFYAFYYATYLINLIDDLFFFSELSLILPNYYYTIP